MSTTLPVTSDQPFIDVKEQLEDLIRNKDKIKTMSKEEVLRLKKAINPTGNLLNKDLVVANLSITNPSADWQQSFTMTAFAGYLYRMLDEYSQERMDEFNTNRGKTGMKSTPYNNIETFLSYHLTFDPDRHVRKYDHFCAKGGKKEALTEAMSTLRATAATKNYMSKPTDINRLCAGAIKTTKAAVARQMDVQYAMLDCVELLVTERSKLAHTLTIWAKVGVSEKVLATMRGAIDSISRSIEQMRVTCDLVTPMEQEFQTAVDAAERISAKDVIALDGKLPPSADLMFAFRRYVENNYDELVAITDTITATPRTMENTVTLYDCFRGPDALEKAKIARDLHGTEFKNSVLCIDNRGTTLLGPWRANRKNAEFFNNNAPLLKEMMAQQQADEALGRDIMKNATKNAKARNIREEGPDATGLSDYTSAMATVNRIGTNAGLTEEQKRELTEDFDASKLVELSARLNDTDKTELLDASRVIEQAMIPNDSIQTEVFTVSGGQIKKDIVYIDADDSDKAFVHNEVEL
jgi:hypothetical protein